MARTITTSSIRALPRNDEYGKKSIPGSENLVTFRRLRRWKSARKELLHRTRNGIHDPFSHFQLVDELLQLQPGTTFTAANLAEWLNKNRPSLLWDAVTVGRILNDIRESCAEANPGEEFQPIIRQRRWDGTFYGVADHPAARVVLFNLLDDLIALGEAIHQEEMAGRFSPRKTSPLASCPSLMPALARAG